MFNSLWRALSIVAILVSLGATLNAGSGEKARRPVRVEIQDEKAVVVEAVLPIDPVKRIQYQPLGNLSVNIREERGQTLHLSHYPTFSIDGQVISAQNGALGQFEVNNGPLPRTLGGKARNGFMS